MKINNIVAYNNSTKSKKEQTFGMNIDSDTLKNIIRKGIEKDNIKSTRQQILSIKKAVNDEFNLYLDAFYTADEHGCRKSKSVRCGVLKRGPLSLFLNKNLLEKQVYKYQADVSNEEYELFMKLKSEDIKVAANEINSPNFLPF